MRQAQAAGCLTAAALPEGAHQLRQGRADGPTRPFNTRRYPFSLAHHLDRSPGFGLTPQARTSPGSDMTSLV